jgi:sporulation protein YlmC with PRC-barrel domain
MKKSIMFGAALALAGLAIAPANAQTQSTTTTQTQSQGFVQSSKIIGSRIRSADGSEVGTIKDIVLDRETGCMAYTVLETADGGPAAGAASSGGTRSTTTTTTRKTVAMPWSGVQVGSEPGVYTTTIQRERIYSAPAYDYARMEEYGRPEYISGVYSYYGVQPSIGISTTLGVGATGTRSGVSTQTGVAAQTTRPHRLRR